MRISYNKRKSSLPMHFCVAAFCGALFVRHLFPIVLTALVLAGISAENVFAQNADAGEKVFKKCSACHQVGEEAKARTGPVLNGIVGAAAGSREDFKYSAAMLESGLTWDHETLARYLRKPKDVVPKTKMAFAGLKGDDEIEDVIAYLASFDVDGTRK